MSRWVLCKRRDFIPRLRKLGFEGPFSGTRHQFMVWCSSLIVGVFISFFFISYHQCDNNKMIEEPKKNEGANGRIMIRHD